MAEIEAAKGSFDDVVMKRRWNLKKSLFIIAVNIFGFQYGLVGLLVDCLLTCLLVYVENPELLKVLS